ncbi:uncharacterized membrane-anchored protein YjiN (DUF445 family) [Paucimonas lemoignei]|uniref:Uncharacterized membrane-anchored protein YjiN (DUF445 family) n=1 Tax=Paucimonas lemoignei TaxID=29443 RepID=A0A4R3I3N0_PAULE|nr:DUF445 domain-containing protein [Paucimonas lemoignei]TCS39663.1 uncharacterized membrane-anchored protein YjiN (DUF445 family) [Paucimonas lemoignei]
MNMDPVSILEQEQFAQLAKVRRFATGLLILMAVIYIIAKRYEVAYPWISLVRAFAEAAMVGALADWFAVTALFKHPLGLPIPHTAIIRKNKDRIGASIANFLEHNFMTRDVISDELRDVNFAAAMTVWLEHPDNSRHLARHLAGAIPALLRMVEDEDIGQFIQQRATAALKEVQFAPLLGELLAILRAGGQHQRVFDHVIELAADALDHNRPYIRQKIHDASPRWLPRSIDEKFFERLLEELNNILDEMRDEDSEWRGRFEIATLDLIDKLKTSPEYEENLARMVRQTLEQKEFRAYLIQLWHDIKERLMRDAGEEDSKAVLRLEQALTAFARALEQNQAVTEKLNRWIRTFATETIVQRRGEIAELVKRVINKWDADTISRKVEVHVGKDLQYIRINGTVVGGLVGLFLHLAAMVLG